MVIFCKLCNFLYDKYKCTYDNNPLEKGRIYVEMIYLESSFTKALIKVFFSFFDTQNTCTFIAKCGHSANKFSVNTNDSYRRQQCVWWS